MTNKNTLPCTRVLISYFADGRVLSEELSVDDLVVYNNTIGNIFILNNHQYICLDEASSFMNDDHKAVVKKVKK